MSLSSQIRGFLRSFFFGFFSFSFSLSFSLLSSLGPIILARTKELLQSVLNHTSSQHHWNFAWAFSPTILSE